MFKPAREQGLWKYRCWSSFVAAPPALPAASMRLAQDHLPDSVPQGESDLGANERLIPKACFSQKTAVFFVDCSAFSVSPSL